MSMQYRHQGWSILGFGCMRFPKKGGGFDMTAVREQIGYAISQGVNYFDTAYIYRGSEQALGTVLQEMGVREQVTIASKMPNYLYKSVDDLERMFQEQLKRLKTSYIDNYLMHMLPDVEIWQKLVSMGVADWIRKKKAAGQIRRIGFSYHGNTENFIRLLDAYDWEFCQVQYNYMDEHSQAGREGVAYAAAKGIPVIIMEPLRGGRLVSGLPEDAEKMIREAVPKRSPAEWAFRWLWDQPEVSVVLSGMNTMDMLKENIRIASEVRTGEFSPEDNALLQKVRRAINAKIKVPCTGCGYCQPCPFGVDIPGIFRCYNVHYTDGWFTGLREYIMCTTFRAEPTNASLCKKCGKCESHCPQNIHIRDELAKAARTMEGPAYKAVSVAARRMFRK